MIVAKKISVLALSVGSIIHPVPAIAQQSADLCLLNAQYLCSDLSWAEQGFYYFEDCVAYHYNLTCPPPMPPIANCVQDPQTGRVICKD